MKFSISDLEQLSGISVHTIRMWERRYQALDPDRSLGNTRSYNDKQLRRFLNIVTLINSGLKISSVCALNEHEIDGLIEQEMEKTVSENKSYEYYISQIICYGFEYNEYQVNWLLSKCIRERGMVETYKNLIYPLLVRLGLMWRIDKICPSQEHFLTSVFRQKIFSSIDELPFNKDKKSCWLLFLPEEEDHDIGLLFANYMLRLAGHHVIYLGPKVPLSAVIHALSKNRVDNLLLFMVRNRAIKETENYLKELLKCVGTGTIHLAGNTKLIGEIDLDPKIDWFQSLDEFAQTIKLPDYAN